MKTDFNYWLDVVKKIIVLALSVFLIYIGFKISIFYIPFLIAFILSLLIEPVIRFLMRKFKMRRKISAILIFIIVLSVIIGVIAWGTVTLISEASNFLGNISYYFDKIHEKSQSLISNFDFDKIKISDELRNILGNSTGEFI